MCTRYMVTHTGPAVLGGDLLRTTLREILPHTERQRRSQHSSPARMTQFSPEICGVTSQTLSLPLHTAPPGQMGTSRNAALPELVSTAVTDGRGDDDDATRTRKTAGLIRRLAGGWDGPMRWGRNRPPIPPEPNTGRPTARKSRHGIRSAPRPPRARPCGSARRPRR